MSNNHLYTRGYFRKRLLEAGITSKILLGNYREGDSRYWTLSLFGDDNIFCTCHKNDKDEYYFEFWDGWQKIKNTHIIRTESMNVIISQLFAWANLDVNSNK